jgi:hypothetical protein
MEAVDLTYTGLGLALHRDEVQGRWLYGVVIDGEFVPLGEHKLGRIDKLLARGADRAAGVPQQPAPQE